MRKALLLFFGIVTVLGLCHGFPLIDIFADEMYFVYGPLTAMQRMSLLPVGVPYGTVTFYGAYLLQGLILIILFAFSGFHINAVTELIMQYPFIAYFAPRILNGILFLTMLIISMRILHVGKKDERPYAGWIIVILFGNLVWLTFAHSGKMWITSVFLIFLTGILLRKSSRNAMIAASLSFANFPLMGIFWLETLLLSLWKEPTWKRRNTIIAIAIIIPLLIILLNASSVFSQVRDVFVSYLFPEIGASPDQAQTFTESFALLYGKTFLSYIVKIIKTSPLALILCLLAWRTRAIIRDKHCFIFSSIGLFLYLMTISSMVFSGSPDSYLRYLIPFQILFFLLFLSVEFRRTKLMTFCMRTLGILSLYCIIIHTVNMVLPTTYQQARQELTRTYNHPDTVILSQVSELSFPYNEDSAQLQREIEPAKCGNRCRYALKHDLQTNFIAAILTISNTDDALKEASYVLRNRNIVHVFYDESMDYTSAEYGLGSYFRLETVLPRRLGRNIIIKNIVTENDE